MCEMCRRHQEPVPERRISPGLATHGAMAEYMLVDSSRHLVPIEDLDPVRAASLTDAALTPYQAITSVLPRLVGGSTTAVIGAGGLGHVAIQRGQIKIKTTTYPIEDGEQANADMHAGKIVGRAVVVP